MPFVSKAQQRWAHSAAGKKAGFGPARLAEWDQATQSSGGFKDLPEHSPGAKKRLKKAFSLK